MGMNRKMRRQMTRERFTDSLKDEQKLNSMYRHASESVFQNVLAAATLVVMYDFKEIQKRETRLNNFLACLDNRMKQIKSNEPLPELAELEREMLK